MEASLSPTGDGLQDGREASAASLNSTISSSSSTGSKQIPPPLTAQRSSSTSRSAHRQSFVESLRNVPPSPRQRNPSLTQAAVQDLLNHPPSANKHADPKFAGREWRDIHVGEIVKPEDVRWIEMDGSVEEATMLLLKSPTNVVLIRENENAKTAVSTFDFSDLNAYLLVVIGLAKPEEGQIELFNSIINKAQQGQRIPLRDIQEICRKETLVNLQADGNLSQAIEILGSGIHQFLVTNEAGHVIGIITQLQVVEFFWSEAINFPSIDRLYGVILRDLGAGSQQVISVK
jgi:hypothetical protein